MDHTLFPKNEEWATGDEALDLRLTLALKKVVNELSFISIGQFYFFASSIKTRSYNPSFIVTIELLTKALLFYLAPNEANDELLKKIKGEYLQKNKQALTWSQSLDVIKGLKEKNTYRYKSQLDFSLIVKQEAERNPFLRDSLVKSPFELHTKIIFKDFKNYLNGDTPLESHDDRLFQALRTKDTILVIPNFAEIWYHQGFIYSLPLFE
ncbi:MAG: hypothetical protein HOP07_14135 [Bacteriovoracaceae bacterium]|nr:hypothetical protein [Bacteriovoracaceae bacterium]